MSIITTPPNSCQEGDRPSLESNKATNATCRYVSFVTNSLDFDPNQSDKCHISVFVAPLAGEGELSDRESSVFEGLVLGWSDEQIADALDLSVGEVESAVATILQKCGKESIRELYSKLLWEAQGRQLLQPFPSRGEE